MLRATITDDRGRVVPLVPLERMAELRDDPERARRLRAVSSMPRRPEPASRREAARAIAYGGVALGLVLATAPAPAWFAFHFNWPWWTKILGAIPLGVVPALVTIWLVRRTAAVNIAMSYVQAGYDFSRTDPDADGCHVCAECGAAWRPVMPNADAR